MRAWGWFVAWLVVGAGYGVALVGALTIGVLVLPVAVAATVAVASRSHGRGMPGLASGLGAPLLYIAYLNRSGPGLVCTAVGRSGQRCMDEGSPWPWVAAGLVLLVGGAAAFSAGRGRRRCPPSPGPAPRG